MTRGYPFISRIMSNSQQPISEDDMNEAIKAYGVDNPDFLKKILT